MREAPSVVRPGCYIGRDAAALPVIYRYFDVLEHAKALCIGQVWLSTFEKCRNHDKLAARDVMEGKRTYRAGLIAGSSDDPANKLRAERSGWSGFSFEDSILVPGSTEQQYRDAYLFCTTVRHDPSAMKDLGTYCVEISAPQHFARSVLHAVTLEFPRIDVAYFDLVTYREQSFEGDGPEPGRIQFTKDPDKYAHEQEARIVFVPSDDITLEGIAPRPFSVPAAVQFCRLLP